MKDYHINVFYSEEDAAYIADFPDLKYCSAHGATPEEALAAVLQAKAAWIAAAREAGIAIPPPSYRNQTPQPTKPKEPISGRKKMALVLGVAFVIVAGCAGFGVFLLASCNFILNDREYAGSKVNSTKERIDRRLGRFNLRPLPRTLTRVHINYAPSIHNTWFVRADFARPDEVLEYEQSSPTLQLYEGHVIEEAPLPVFRDNLAPDWYRGGEIIGDCSYRIPHPIDGDASCTMIFSKTENSIWLVFHDG